MRNALPPEKRAAGSAEITGLLTELDEIRRAATIMVFLNFGSEVETDGLIARCWEMGKRVVAPLCFPETRQMDPCLINDFNDLESGNYGIREPKAASSVVVPHEEIDVVLIPAVAFDRQGQRIGYGGGYYDRFLPMVPRATRIGVVFSCQLIEKVSVGEHDIPVQMIVTEAGVIHINER